LLVFSIFAAGCGDEESRREIEKLRQLAADTQVYPGFVQLRNGEYHKTSHALLIRCYSAQADGSDVKRFYSQQFEAKGWKLTEDKQSLGFFPEGSYVLTFRKGAYEIVLQHNNHNNPRDCNYDFSYLWNPFEPLIKL
jgi:hypothetical protein